MSLLHILKNQITVYGDYIYDMMVTVITWQLSDKGNVTETYKHIFFNHFFCLLSATIHTCREIWCLLFAEFFYICKGKWGATNLHFWNIVAFNEECSTFSPIGVVSWKGLVWMSVSNGFLIFSVSWNSCLFFHLLRYLLQSLLLSQGHITFMST